MVFSHLLKKISYSRKIGGSEARKELALFLKITPKLSTIDSKEKITLRIVIIIKNIKEEGGYS